MITILSSELYKITAQASGGVASKNLNAYAGIHTDTKPTEDLVTGSIFIEVDTGDVYFYDEEGTAWVKQYSLQS